MKRIMNNATFEKEKAQIKKEMKERLDILQGKKRLIPAWEKEIENITKVLEIFDSLSLDLFREIPENGLVSDWTNKILGVVN